MTGAIHPSAADTIGNRVCADAGEGVDDRHLRALRLGHGTLVAAFEARYAERPEDFDPVPA